jgi:hypothetical protein
MADLAWEYLMADRGEKIQVESAQIKGTAGLAQILSEIALVPSRAGAPGPCTAQRSAIDQAVLWNENAKPVKKQAP